jgi:hypothetical protein
VKSVLIRIRRICTKYSDFVFYYSVIRNQFILRGYEKNIISKIFTMVSSLERDKLLEYKEKNRLNFNCNFIYKFNFDNNISNFNNLASHAFENFKKDNEKFKNFKLKIVNKMQLNLSSLLIHNFKFPSVIKCFYKKCSNINCNTCLYSNNKHSIYLTEDFILPVIDFSSCNSINCVYIIFCSLCNAFYIGQTICIKDRIYNHIYNIKNFTPYTSNDYKCVSIHFNLKFHNFKHHFSYFIIKTNLEDLEARLNVESFLINLCVKMNIKVINDFIPEIKNFYAFG